MADRKYTYQTDLKDYMGGKLNKLATVGSAVYGKLNRAQRFYNKQVAIGSRNVNQMSNATRLLGAFSAYKMIQLGKDTLNLAGNIEQVNIKYEKVFGTSSKLVEISKSQRNALGLTNHEYRKATSAVGDLLIPMGFQRQAAAGMSKDLIGLSGALAEWSGGTYKSSQVSEILSKAMLGEREQLKSLGIAISENDVKNRISAMGHSNLTGKAFEQAKAMATMQLIMEKSTDAQNAFANGAGSLARKKTMLFTTLRNYYQMLANKMIPVFQNWLDKAMSMVNWVVRNAEMLKIWGTVIAGFVAGYYSWIMVTNLLSKATMIYKSIQFVVIGLTRGWAVAQRALNLTMAANPIGLIIAGVAALAVAVVYAWKKFEWFRGTVLGVWEVVKGFGTMIKDYVINRFWELINGLTGIGKTIKLLFQGEWKQAWEAGKTAASNLLGIESKAEALKQGIGLGQKFTEGYAKGAKQVEIGKGMKKASAADYLNNNNDTVVPSLATNDAVKNGLSSITSGGSRPTNITINLGKFQDQIVIHAANVKEGAQEMRAIIIEEFARVLNSANFSASQ